MDKRVLFWGVAAVVALETLVAALASMALFRLGAAEARISALESRAHAPPAPSVTQTASPTVNVGAPGPVKTHLSAAAFARLHGVNEWTVRDWISSGKIDPSPSKGDNGYWQIDRDAVVSP